MPAAHNVEVKYVQHQVTMKHNEATSYELFGNIMVYYAKKYLDIAA